MTKIIKLAALGAAALAVVATPMAASAQSYRGDRDHDGRYERNERRADRNRYDGGRYTNRERYNDDRRYARDQRQDYRYDQRRYYRGGTLPYQYRSNWYIRDYNRYGYAPPPRGYGYYRTDTGDIVLAALATGVIISLLSN
ncbi:RcnB family protein [Brevundimonas goettingensis]|uniref:RcnB family protein n=1 Tax=Brevundimonas goettingensis TaxID=2774190 RepID=A0A975C6K2_9CAUL|nr:RcnB family protein [Brevundimonas goettingensis]QTC92512.1 RcnB family protein [Brevundimonas goettingensis]